MAPTSAKEECHYPAKLISLAEPAGRYVVCHSLKKDGPMRVASNPWSIVGAPKARMKGYGYSKCHLLMPKNAFNQRILGKLSIDSLTIVMQSFWEIAYEANTVC
jgi:hypothetical protein